MTSDPGYAGVGLLTFVLAAVVVGVVLQVIKGVILLALRAVFESSGAAWWSVLPADEKDRMAGRLASSFHHLVAAGLSLAAIVDHDPLRFQQALLWEAGFDIADSALTVIGRGFTGLQGLPLYLHHGVALLMEVACVAWGYDWHKMAQCFAILLGFGALDMFFSKVVPRTPLQQSRLLVPALVLQFISFVVLRQGYLSLVGYELIAEAWRSGPVASGVVVTTCAVMFSLYHLLLGSGLYRIIRAGGQMPPAGAQAPSSSTTKHCVRS